MRPTVPSCPTARRPQRASAPCAAPPSKSTRVERRAWWCRGLGGLCVLTVALFVAAVNKDSAIVRLQQHGVPVEVTVTSCLGNLGGSGSNAASYTCSGTFSLDGHHQTDVIDGTTTFHRSGSTIAP